MADWAWILAILSGSIAEYTIHKQGSSFVIDGIDGLDTLAGIEFLSIGQETIMLGTLASPILEAYRNISRLDPNLDQIELRDFAALASSAGVADALPSIIDMVDDTTAVAVISYQFFTGKTPTQGGLNYLINSPNAINSNDLNNSYYQTFNVENRYINFAVNLGKLGEGRAAFQAEYGALSLFDATKNAYIEIFGTAAFRSKDRTDYRYFVIVFRKRSRRHEQNTLNFTGAMILVLKPRWWVG